MKEICGASISSEVIDLYPKTIDQNEVEVPYEYLNVLLGVTIPKEEVHTILEALEIRVTSSNEESFKVSVPTNKVDVTRPADIAEEVIRIYGYDHVPIPAKVNMSLSYAPSIDGDQIYNRFN